jgi:TonB family protein
MPTLIDNLSTPTADGVAFATPETGGVSIPSARSAGNLGPLLAAILTTSICLHLLVVGYLGFGVPAEAHRPHVVRAAPPPPPIIENVQIEAPPPPKAAPQVLRDVPPPEQDQLAPAAVVAAVPADVAVAFAIKVAGPVRLVSDAAEATGISATPPLPALPREVVGRNLLTSQVAYPPAALVRHLTGRVVIEFHTSPTGDITDARVRVSSGSELLDQAALENLRQGRWVGDAGYFTKTYDFVLR